MKKILLILTALTVSVAAFAEKITTVAGITSGNKYYIGATTSSTDYYFYVDGSSATASIKGVAKEDVADAVALTFTAVTGGWTIQFDNGLYLGLKNANDNGKVQVKEDLVVWTIEEDTDKGLLKLHPNNYYLQKNNSGTQFGSYKATQTNVWLESAGSAPVSPILESVYIKGDATKKEYEVGESFDPAGLEVWGVYTKTVKNDTESQITSGITWTIDPETFTEASDNASVKLSASFKDKTSEDKTITGIKVKEKVVTYANTYTSGVELSTEGGTSASAAKVKWKNIEYNAIKAGTSSVAGACVVSIPASTKTLHFHAAGWKGETVKLDVNGTEYALVADAGVANSTPFTLQNDPETQDYFTFDPKGATTITFKATAGKRFVLFGVNAELAEGTVAVPSFAPTYTEFDGSVEVSLTCDTEGAEIYYTLDGSAPSATSTKYEAPFTLTATTTVKAIAVKDGKSSAVAEKAYTLIPAFESLEALVTNLPATETNKTVIVTITDAVIDSLYVTGKGYTNGIYVTAANTVVELYTNDVPGTWEVGGKVSGTIIAEWLLYKGTPELQKWEGGWSKFTYTAPASGPTVDETGITVNGRKYGFPVRLVKEVK